MRQMNIQEWFTYTAEKFSGNTAIECLNKQITYADLERNSNRMANFLLASGATKGEVVSIMARDPINIITSIIAVLKAGCAFMPLDLSIPPLRIGNMISAVSPNWFIIESTFASALNDTLSIAGLKSKVVCIDEGGVIERGFENLVHLREYSNYSMSHRPELIADPDDLSYIYFTSGSTGKPKAIAGRLKGIDHFIRWEIDTLGLDETARVSHLLSPTFDGSLRDIFAPLCSGGVICVPDGKEMILDGRKLVDWLDRQGISIIHCVPSTFRALMNEALDAGRFASLKYVVLTGEALLPSDVKRWVEIFSDRIQLINLYGTSETTMCKLVYFVRQEDKDRRSIPIGKPMPGASALILNEKWKPCPTGIVGEVYLRTQYRSLGYYNQPDLTREVFLQNPFTDDPNDIIYKTGDLARLLEDGNFEYVGRVDQQVKIRGMRVELTEIEKLLRAFEGVKDVAVIDRQNATGHDFLCAYLVLSRELGVNELREYLAEQLPEYMVPTTYVVMDDLPKTISGKIDRRALPAPQRESCGLKQEYAEPQTPVEKILAEIWSELLVIERIGTRDNFFQIGGHSLLAMQLLSRVRQAFKVEIPLRILFELPTIADLAILITQKQIEQEDGDEIARLIEEIKKLPEDALEAYSAMESC